MSEPEPIEIRSPLTRPPRKPSYMILWIFLAVAGGIVLVVAANMILGPGPGGMITAGAYIFAVVGIRALRWWSERNDGPQNPMDRWLG